MNKPHITIVSNDDDWEGLYIDGKLFTQDHSLSAEDILRAMRSLNLITTEDKFGTPALTGYCFPEKLEHVQYDPDWTENYED